MKKEYSDSADMQKDVLELIGKSPAICVIDICNKLEVDNQHSVYSLIFKLEDAGSIVTRIADGRKHCFLKGTAPKILLSSSAQKMYEVIKNYPKGIPIQEAVRIAKLSDNSWRYARELGKFGLAYIKKENGKKTLIFPNSHPNAVGVDSLKEIYPLSQEEIDVLMTPGNNAEEIIKNSGKAGGFVRTLLKSALGKCGAWTIHEARSLSGISIGEKEKCLVK